MESQKEQALHPLLLPLCVLVCGGAMIGVFRLLGKLDDSVLYGAALGCGICILNLFLLRFAMNRAAAAQHGASQSDHQSAISTGRARAMLGCTAHNKFTALKSQGQSGQSTGHAAHGGAQEGRILAGRAHYQGGHTTKCGGFGYHGQLGRTFVGLARLKAVLGYIRLRLLLCTRGQTGRGRNPLIGKALYIHMSLHLYVCMCVTSLSPSLVKKL